MIEGSLSVRVLPGMPELSEAVAREIASRIDEGLRAADGISLVLAGGGTPRTVYDRLADAYRDRIPWDRVHLFQGDERFVPADHPESNYRMVVETLLSRVPVPPENVHRVPTEMSTPGEAAEEYERTIRDFLAGRPEGRRRFDLVLLGVGEDGHTASLFPASGGEGAPPDARAAGRWVTATRAPATYPTRERITLTYEAINGAAVVLVLAAGAAKRGPVAAALGGGRVGELLPIQRVRPAGDLVWLIDAAAAGAAEPGAPRVRPSDRTDPPGTGSGE